MERMPKIVWNKEEGYCTGALKYWTVVKCEDKKGRAVFYKGFVIRHVSFDQRAKQRVDYHAECALYTDGNNFRLRGDTYARDFTNITDAKKWVEDAFRAKWTRDHYHS